MAVEDRGGKEMEVEGDLDVVVGAGGGEAAGGGVEVEAEHRLQVVPVDLHRPAPHLALPSPSSSSIDGFLLRRVRPQSLSPSASAWCARFLSLSLSRVGFGLVLGDGGKREAIGRAHLLDIGSVGLKSPSKPKMVRIRSIIR